MLVAKVREGIDQGCDLADAIDAAVNWCINHDCMVEYLRKHKEEVADMWLTEFDEEEYKEAMKEEGRAEGRAEAVDILIAKKKLSMEEACDLMNLSTDEYKNAKQLLCDN